MMFEPKKIEPCVYCGRNDAKTYFKYFRFKVLCYCGASGRSYTSRKDAIEAWNHMYHVTPMTEEDDNR